MKQPVIATRYEAVIGLEVHAQLLTKSKMFCSCRADYQDAPPNTLVCPVCLGMPGVLPVINKLAVEFTIMTGLTLNCTISQYTKFDRKNYPYPDLMKGYQISQYDMPIARDGFLEVEVDGKPKHIGIIRVHLEEDVAKLFHVKHPSGEAYSLLDVNRSGVPLMEIVSKPDMRSPEEARQYLIAMRSILQYLGVSNSDMEKGNFRCDANLSIRPVGSTELMSKVEVKNMNSFRAVFNALIYEFQRQVEVVGKGERVVQETRGWVEEKGVTFSQRTKEYAHDYRYFPEPDLPPLHIDPAWVEQIRRKLPELPAQRKERFIEQYGLPAYDATLLTNQKTSADFFEKALAAPTEGRGVDIKKRAKATSNWMLGDLAALLNASGKEINEAPITPQHLVELVELLESGAINMPTAKSVLEQAFKTGKAPSQIVKESGLTQISDQSLVEHAVEEAIRSNPQPVSDYLKGKETAARFLVGQVMKLTKGQANPTLVNNLVKAKLDALKASSSTAERS